MEKKFGSGGGKYEGCGWRERGGGVGGSRGNGVWVEEKGGV